MAPAPALAGVTVLDLSTVGPGPRCTRILADYGAKVVKIGAPRAGLQIEPATWAYGGGRGWTHTRIDLKSADGKGEFLALARGADVVLESYRPGVVARLGIDYDAVRALNPGIVYCSTSGYGQAGPASKWAGHDLNYLAMGGYLAMSGRRADGGPALPGATIADAAAGGMHAALAILAALLRRTHTGVGEFLDVSVADGVLSLMSLAIDQHAATGAEMTPGGDLLTGRYACYDVYRSRDDKWIAVGAIEPQFWANLCKALGCERWTAHQTDDAVQASVRADLRAAFATRDRDDWVAALAPADTCVAPVYEVAEVLRDPHFAARGAFANGQVAPLLAGQRFPRSEPQASGENQNRENTMTETDTLPDEVRGWIGKRRYEQEGDFDVERGYVFTSCASVENGNPLFWDEKAAHEITGGFIAPPTMISVWFRPHAYAPNRPGTAQPLQVHFDLKEKLGLPEAVMTDNTIVFRDPVRPGDRLRTWQVLRSVSEPKTTKLGTGRFWVIDVEYVNQKGESVGTESYTGFGYARQS